MYPSVRSTIGQSVLLDAIVGTCDFTLAGRCMTPDDVAKVQKEATSDGGSTVRSGVDREESCTEAAGGDMLDDHTHKVDKTAKTLWTAVKRVWRSNRQIRANL